MKKHTTISFLDIESIPQLIKDLLTQKTEGFERNIFTLENIEEQYAHKAEAFSQKKRKILSGVLKRQNSDLVLSEKQQINLRILNDPHTFTVTTGHQLNLFTGPVFFIYKILQTIKLAEHLNQSFPERKTVPVFWMATEDHDFEEINHFNTRTKYYETKAEAGGAVGRIHSDDHFFIDEFEREFKDSVYGTELILMMKRAYKEKNSLAKATKILVHELFSQHGLLVIDGDDAGLKCQMTEIFRGELLDRELYTSTEPTVSALAAKYGKVQVNPREINLFYLSETRDRIEFDGEKYIIVDKNISFSEEEILNELQNHPEKFSPNALMRPVFQESVLPNIAYIGGNAEIMYWLELKLYFEKINLPFPVLIPRNSMLNVSEKTLVKTEKLGLKINDFFRNFAEVTKEIILDGNEILTLLGENETLLRGQFEELATKASMTDKSFGTLVDAEQTRQLKSYQRMKKRLLRAEKIKQHEKLQRLDNLFLEIHPGKSWQERVLNFSVFYADHGHEWLQSCYDGMSVAEPQLIIVSI